MATTTNYGWTTPDNTALVKDGASAIRTLGSSVDTSLKSLSPGTTAGDVDYYTSSTAKARLAIGTTGQVLTVAAGVPSWATATAGGLTSLATGTLSGTSVTISSISQSYKNLFLVISSAVTNTGGVLSLRANGITSANYNQTRIQLNSATLESTSAAAYFQPSSGGGGTQNIPTTANDHVYTLEILNYTLAKYQAYSGSFRTSGNTYSGSNFFGQLNSVAAVTSLTIGTVSGTPTYSAGTYTLYGVN